ncbi:uncharacterized protein EHS24_003699 [Apiotrichum porosum]|uniref:Uncharacterized protein n=1 Tax=Apiotrichum porosum TaxID=105984 RepID=A0A427XE83_9TREE|nr:uncharacterized protein EHS24_003699 [Apiotrichum porosum]RSH77073.1 hypothetical protein EHS24_003699 [Apiotrichum porosum]
MPTRTLTSSFLTTSWSETEAIPPLADQSSVHIKLGTEEAKFSDPEWNGTGLGQAGTSEPSVWHIVGHMLFKGEFLGKKGSFVVQALSTYNHGKVKGTWTILSDSATIKGHGKFHVDQAGGSEPTECELTVES